MAAGTPRRRGTTSRWWFVTGTIWALIGLGRLLSVLVGGDHRVWSEVLAAGSLATAVLWLGSAVTVRRRERSRAEKTPAEDP